MLLAGTLVYAAYLHIRAARSGQVRTSELVCVFLIMASASWEMLSFLLWRTQVGMYVRISFLIFALNFLRLTILRIYRVWRENYKLEQQLEISRLELMNSQIRPHFIYNTLNSIRALIRLDPERACQAVLRLFHVSAGQYAFPAGEGTDSLSGGTEAYPGLSEY